MLCYQIWTANIHRIENICMQLSRFFLSAFVAQYLAQERDDNIMVNSSDLEVFDCLTTLVDHVCLSIKLEFKQLLMLLLVSNTTESHLLEVISWVYVSKLRRRRVIMKRGKEPGPDVI